MKVQSIGKKYNRGSSTIEILIAFVILALSVTAAELMTFGNQSVTVDSQTSNEALSKAQGMLEVERALSRHDFASVQSIATTTDDIYQKSVMVTFLDTFTKQVTSFVSWGALGGRNLAINLTTLLTDAASSAGSCSQVLSGDWKSPQHYDYSTADLISAATGNHSNGLELTDVKAYRQKLYLSAKTTSATNGFTFYIFDLPASPNVAPTYDGGLDNSPTVAVGINALTLFGKYAYAANAYTGSSQNCALGSNCAQLQIIDVSVPTAPTIVTNVKIPGIASGKLSAATSVLYNKGYVYVGLAKVSLGSTNGEFNIVDVGGGGAPASPTNPILKGTYLIGNGVNSIFVRDKYAYVASPNSENVTVLDISNPNTPVRVGGYTPPGPLPDTTDGVGSDHGESVFLLGSSLYLGRTYGTKELYSLDVTTPSSPALIGSKDVGTGNLTSIGGLAVRDHLAFAITNAQFQVWDIASPATIVPWSTDGTSNTFLALDVLGGNGASSLSCSGDRFYAAIQDKQGNKKDIVSIITSYIPTFSYSLAPASPTVTIARGSSGTSTITLTQTAGSTTQPVSVSLSGLPNKVTSAPATVSCTPATTCTVSFTISVQSTAQKATNTITVSGTSPAQSTTFQLTIN